MTMDWLFDQWYKDHEVPHYTLSPQVMAVLESMPREHRDVLEARYYERLSYRQLAVRFTTSRHPGSGGWVLEKAERAFRTYWIHDYGEVWK
jgi:hypothetical protein